MASPQDLVPVTDAAGPAEAHIIASMLRESGVEAFVFDTANQTLQWDAPRIINPYLVHVKREDIERARQLIKSNREESVDLDWDEVDVGNAGDETVAEVNRRPERAEIKPAQWKFITPLNLLIFIMIMAIVFAVILFMPSGRSIFGF